MNLSCPSKHACGEDKWREMFRRSTNLEWLGLHSYSKPITGVEDKFGLDLERAV
jgi:hypothetical protein